MKKLQGGFTLIELVMVIVVLGILAAIAIPKYVDFKTDAANAATKGVAGALASASAILYAANKLNPTTNPLTNNTCALIKDQLTTAPASNFTVSGTTPACTVTNSDGGTPVDFNLSQ